MTSVLCKRIPWTVCTRIIHRHACTSVPEHHKHLIRSRELRKQRKEEEAGVFLDNLDEVSASKAKSIQLEYLDYFYFNAPHLDENFKSLSAIDVKRLLTESRSESDRLSYYQYLVTKTEHKLTRREATRMPSDEVYKYMLQPYRNISSFNRHRAVFGFLYGSPIVLDLDYTSSPIYKRTINFEIGKCYKNNTSHHQPFQLHLTGLKNNEVVKEEFREGGTLEHLFVHCHDECFMDILPHHRLVYLTPNAPPLTEHDGNRIYVIGGLLDRDKNCESLSKAKRYGISYGSLPLDKYVRFNDGWAKKTLAIHEVLGLLLDMNLTHQWRFSIKNNIPITSYLSADMIDTLSQMDSETDRKEFLWKICNSP